MCNVCSKHSRMLFKIGIAMFISTYLPHHIYMYVYVYIKDTHIIFFKWLNACKSPIQQVLCFLKCTCHKHSLWFYHGYFVMQSKQEMRALNNREVARSFYLFSMFRVSQSKRWFSFIVKYLMIADCKNFIMEIFLSVHHQQYALA